MAMQDPGGILGGVEGVSSWQSALQWLDDDEDQDSDTDSKLSGSAAADSVLRHLSRSRPPFKLGGNEFSLGPMREEEEDGVEGGSSFGGQQEISPHGSSAPINHPLNNGYHHHQHLLHQHNNVSKFSPQAERRQNSSTKFHSKTNYENMIGGGGGGGGGYPHKKDSLSTVSESNTTTTTTTGGTRVVEVPSTQHTPQRNWGAGSSGSSGSRSMDNMPQGTPPSHRRRNYDQHLPNGRVHYRDVRIPHTNGGVDMSSTQSRSYELLPQVVSGEGVGVAYGVDRMHDDTRSDLAYQQHPLSQPHSHTGNSWLQDQMHQRSMSIGSARPVPSQPSSSRSHSIGNNLDSRKTPPQRRVNYIRQEILRDQGTSQGGLLQDGPNILKRGEPNLKDVVQFLGSEDKMLVSNASSYLQHLAYGDDTMKTKIREHGAIPILVSLIRHGDTKVQITALGALKNLSFGRTTNENKHVIADDHGLSEIMVALKNSRVQEVRELLTALLWNLSSCEDLKLKMIKACLHDLVEIVMVPHTGWSTQEARELTARPHSVMWNIELKNTTGTLRNLSSAGESARSFMRNTNGMVDTLLWLLKAGVQQKSAADEKTVENTACILRNLSYRLENEVDPQEGGEDILDRDWEQEQRQEVERVNHQSLRKSSPRCLAFCMRSQTRDDVPRVTLTAMSRPVYNVNFVFPGASAMPKRRRPVYGKCLLWQPEVAYVYLAVVEQYPDSVDAVEAATGTLQNLTACNWKWAVYIRNILHTSNGLHLLVDLLNSGHDTVVRTAATSLRNVAVDQKYRSALGDQGVTHTIPRLPLSTNHLGISEETSIALLCFLMELFTDNPGNAKFFLDKDGIAIITRLARSRQHTTKVVFAAHKVCSILWEHKSSRSALKKAGWELSLYNRLAKDGDAEFNFEPRWSMSRDYQGSRRRKHSGGKRTSKKLGKKKDKEDVVGFIAGGLPSGELAEVPQHSSASSDAGISQTSPATSLTSPQQFLPQITEEPNYQMIPATSTHSNPISPPSPIEPNYQSVPTPPDRTSPNSNLPGPTIIYQSIDDPKLKSEVQVICPQVEESAMSTTTTSEPTSVTSQEEDQEQEHDPNATYASVDIEKKRESRRIREQKKKEKQKQELEDSMDSWV